MSVPTIDFSPLGDLYNTYQKGQQGAALQNFGEALQGPGQPNYQSLAALAAQAGRPELAISLLQQSDNRAAGQTLASMFGAQQSASQAQQAPQAAPSAPMASPTSMPVGAPTSAPRPGGPVPSSPTVWGDAEAEAAGLYDKPGQPTASPAAPVQVAQAGSGMPAPSAAGAGAGRPQATAGVRAPGSGMQVLETPATQGMPENIKKALPVLLSSPQYANIGLAMLQKYINPEQFSLERDSVGNIYSRNNQSQERKLIVGATPQAANAAASGLPNPLAYETALKQAETDAKNRELTGPQKEAGMTAPGAAPAAAAPDGGNPPLNPVVAYKGQEKVVEGIAKDMVDAQGKATPAQQRLQQLDTISQALRQGAGNITTGPFAELALKGKQALSSAFNIDLAGVPEAEVAQKTGVGLAIQTVKELTNRGTQFELKTALQNNPGLLLSPAGSQMMIGILKQSAQQDIDVSKLASNPANLQNWQNVKDAYYKSHPIISPFTGKPFGDADVKFLQQQGGGGSTNTGTGGTTKSGVKWSIQ